jgi:hypothetical protein
MRASIITLPLTDVTKKFHSRDNAESSSSSSGMLYYNPHFRFRGSATSICLGRGNWSPDMMASNSANDFDNLGLNFFSGRNRIRKATRPRNTLHHYLLQWMIPSVPCNHAPGKPNNSLAD